MHVGENQEAQLLPHVHRVHGKVVLEPGDGDESVQLQGDGRRALLIRRIHWIQSGGSPGRRRFWNRL